MPPLLLAALLLAEAPVPRVDPAEVQARGAHVALLTVPRFGRYALTVKSDEGAALRLVDRMAGPSEPDGVPGERDGRLDVFLERGEYRVVVDGHERAKGVAKLAVRPFHELQPEPPLLVANKPVQAALRDLEQRSYWLRVEKAQTVALEAAGRDLADLRLWRDGTWLVDAEPERERVQPTVGHPLTVCRLSPRLEPGLYLLAAYGGPALPWAEDDGSHPFHLRDGLPRIPEAGRRRFTVSPFGVDRYLAPGSVTFVRVELPEARPALVQAGPFDPEQPFAAAFQAGSIAKETNPPAVQLTLAARPTGDQVVVVSGGAGQPYVLQQFHALQRWNPVPPGALWIGTVHAGAAEDSIDATGVLAHTRGSRLEITAEDVLTLDANGAWTRRANLLGTLSAVLRLPAGRYEVLLSGVDARARLEPLLLTHAADYREPPLKASGGVWDLEAGDHLLTVSPVEKGIVTITVRQKTLAGAVLSAVGLATPPAARPVRAALRFPPASGNQWLFVGAQPGVEVGLIARPVPIDLTDPLFVAQQPGETVTVPFVAPEASTLAATAEDGGTLEVSVDGGPFARAQAVASGTHQAVVRHDRPQTTLYTIALAPDRLRAEAPLPPLPEADKAALPDFPALTPGAPRFLDLERQREATFRLTVPEPGLYEMATIGLLATAGRVRTRTRPELDSGEANGVGRNVSLRQYLREGDYELTVQTRGQSQGHLGVRVDRTPLLQGGFLTNLVPARVTLKPGEAVAYRFNITRPGTFHIRSLGLGRAFRCRLEDTNGWPVMAPGAPADLTQALGPGKYRFIVLPETTEARVLTVIEPVYTPRPRAGHGPHRLRLGQRQAHLWTEPEGAAERVPDQWDFDLRAAVDATIALDGDMQGELVRRDAPAAVVAAVPAGRGFTGPLEAGAYRLKTVSARRNNRAPYTITVSTGQLLPGQSREVPAPSESTLAIGEAGLYEIATFGGADVAARLFDASGVQLASADDAPDDWNPHLALSLAPGRYRLRIDPVSGASASTRVSVRRPEEKLEPALALPASLDASPGAAAWLWPLSVPAGSGIVSASARSTDSVGLTLEASIDGSWAPVASSTGRRVRAEAATDPRATAWRLRAWSLDHRDSSVHIEAAALAPPSVEEPDAARGTTLATGAVRLRLDRPGVFRFSEGARVCAQPLVPCADAAGVVAVPGAAAWILGDKGARVTASRVVLSPGQALTVGTPEGGPLTIDVARGKGPRTLLVSSRTGQPGAAFGVPRGAFSPGALSAIAATVGDATAATAWPATGAASQELRLALQAMAAPEEIPLRAGLAEAEVAKDGACTVDLGRGRKRLQLALGEGVVALLGDGTNAQGVHGGFDATTEALETDADRLTLLATRGRGRFAVESVPIAQASVLAPGAPYEADFATAGVLRLEVKGSAGAHLHVRGATGVPVLLSRDGHVGRGPDLDAGAPGSVLITHPPGLLLAWVDTADHAGPWPATAGPAAKVVSLPASLPLAGAAEAVAVDLDAPAFLHLRAPSRATTLVKRPGADAPEVHVGRDGTRLDVFVPAGRTEVRLRAIGGGSLGGALDLTATPVTQVGEGLGPEVLLAPGSARLFAFEAGHEGPVGIGVRASAGSVDAILLDAGGKELGRGAAQMPTLKPGRYLIALTARPDGPTVRGQVALAGLTLPDIGPPDEVARRYLQPEDEALQPLEFTATRASGTWSGTVAEEGQDEAPGLEEGGGDEEAPADEEPPAEEEAAPGEGSTR